MNRTSSQIIRVEAAIPVILNSALTEIEIKIGASSVYSRLYNIAAKYKYQYKHLRICFHSQINGLDFYFVSEALKFKNYFFLFVLFLFVCLLF